MAVDTDILPPRYHKPRLIARGGMGDIYRATDSTLGRVVAIKVLADRYAEDQAVRERFTREALAAARVSGEPNTVTIFDVGKYHELPYIVMEYLSRRARLPDHDGHGARHRGLPLAGAGAGGSGDAGQ